MLTERTLRPALEAMELETPKFWLFLSYMQTVAQLSTSLHLITSTLLPLLILNCEGLLCYPHFYTDLKVRPPETQKSYMQQISGMIETQI